MPSSLRRAVGVVRVSRKGDRDGESYVSPSEQRERIVVASSRDELDLVDTLEEENVSGGAPLSRRPGMRRAVEMVEAGEADVVIVAYFDRLVRSLQVQHEILDRVEQAGGAVIAVDVGEVRADTASRWLSSTMLGMVAEYHRLVTAERTLEAKRRAVARGVPPFPNVPPGYRRRKDGSLERHPKQARIVARAFELRASGATVMEVREYLREHGIERSFHGTQALLTSRIVLGELRFGKIVNTNAHPAIVDAVVWKKVQRMRSPRGRRAKSDRLLARLGVLRCETCGARMVVGSTDQNGKRHYMYRCPPIGDCPRRVSISAELAEREAVYERTDEIRESASIERELDDADQQAKLEKEKLDTMIEALTGFEDSEKAREKLLAQRECYELAVERADELRRALPPTRTAGARDMNDAELRALIRALRTRAVVAPGRGPDRVTVEFLAE
jgi:DNA invertase Pin-like site-specific DNA recombinase